MTRIEKIDNETIRIWDDDKTEEPNIFACLAKAEDGFDSCVGGEWYNPKELSQHLMGFDFKDLYDIDGPFYTRKRQSIDPSEELASEIMNSFDIEAHERSGLKNLLSYYNITEKSLVDKIYDTDKVVRIIDDEEKSDMIPKDAFDKVLKAQHESLKSDSTPKGIIEVEKEKHKKVNALYTAEVEALSKQSDLNDITKIPAFPGCSGDVEPRQSKLDSAVDDVANIEGTFNDKEYRIKARGILSKYITEPAGGIDAVIKQLKYLDTRKIDEDVLDDCRKVILVNNWPKQPRQVDHEKVADRIMDADRLLDNPTGLADLMRKVRVKYIEILKSEYGG